MVLAVVEGESAYLSIPWPRPDLRLVPPVEIVEDVEATLDADVAPYLEIPDGQVFSAWDDSDAASQGDFVDWSEEGWLSQEFPMLLGPEPELRLTTDVRRRRQARALRRYRHRRAAVGLLVVGVISLLALPFSATGGTAAQGGAAAGGSTRGDHTVIVQQGDTLWSIAQRIDGSGNPRALVAELEGSLGSAEVTPGEHIAVP